MDWDPEVGHALGGELAGVGNAPHEAGHSAELEFGAGVAVFATGFEVGGDVVVDLDVADADQAGVGEFLGEGFAGDYGGLHQLRGPGLGWIAQ
jgi:hypothetical protein